MNLELGIHIDEFSLCAVVQNDKVSIETYSVKHGQVGTATEINLTQPNFVPVLLVHIFAAIEAAQKATLTKTGDEKPKELPF